MLDISLTPTYNSQTFSKFLSTETGVSPEDILVWQKFNIQNNNYNNYNNYSK